MNFMFVYFPAGRLSQTNSFTSSQNIAPKIKAVLHECTSGICFTAINKSDTEQALKHDLPLFIVTCCLFTGKSYGSVAGCKPASHIHESCA